MIARGKVEVLRHITSLLILIVSYPCAVLVFRHQIYFKIASELSYIHWEGAAVLYEISYVLELLGLPEKMTELNLCLNVFDATPPICPTENVDVSKSFYDNVSGKLL